MLAINYIINGFKIYAMKRNEMTVQINTMKHTLQQKEYKINNSLKQKLNKDNITHHFSKKKKIKGKQDKGVKFTYLGHEIKKSPYLRYRHKDSI